jgi:hypothetical protein
VGVQDKYADTLLGPEEFFLIPAVDARPFPAADRLICYPQGLYERLINLALTPNWLTFMRGFALYGPRPRVALA